MTGPQKPYDRSPRGPRIKKHKVYQFSSLIYCDTCASDGLRAFVSDRHGVREILACDPCLAWRAARLRNDGATVTRGKL